MKTVRIARRKVGNPSLAPENLIRISTTNPEMGSIELEQHYTKSVKGFATPYKKTAWYSGNINTLKEVINEAQTIKCIDPTLEKDHPEYGKTFSTLVIPGQVHIEECTIDNLSESVEKSIESLMKKYNLDRDSAILKLAKRFGKDGPLCHVDGVLIIRNSEFTDSQDFMIDVLVAHTNVEEGKAYASARKQAKEAQKQAVSEFPGA